MRRSAVRLAAAVLVLVSCDRSPSAPAETALIPSLDRVKDGQPDHQHIRAPFSRTVSNPCPPVPEAVAVEGFTQFTSHFKFFDGGNESRHHIMSQASGIGAVTGARYTFHELFRQDGIYHYSDGVYDTVQEIRWHVISQSNGGNFFATTRQKMICDANACRVEPISIETDCRG